MNKTPVGLVRELEERLQQIEKERSAIMGLLSYYHSGAQDTPTVVSLSPRKGDSRKPSSALEATVKLVEETLERFGGKLTVPEIIDRIGDKLPVTRANLYVILSNEVRRVGCRIVRESKGVYAIKQQSPRYLGAIPIDPALSIEEQILGLVKTMADYSLEEIFVVARETFRQLDREELARLIADAKLKLKTEIVS